MGVNIYSNNNLAPNIELCRHNYNNTKSSVKDSLDTKVQEQLPTNKPNKVFSRKKFLGDLSGIIVGLTAPAYILYDAFEKIDEVQAKNMAEEFRELVPPVEDFESTKSTALKILEESGLKTKGVDINFIDGSYQSINNLRENIFGSGSNNSFFGTRLRENDYNIFKEGANAGFFTNTNKVVVSTKGIYDYVYHELGHAMNKNGNFITKALIEARNLTPLGVSVIAPIALGVGIFHKPDNTKPKSEKNIFEKCLDFVSQHPVSLTFASYMPILAEEGLASVRGLKWASKYLEPQKIKKLAINYAHAWKSYAKVAGIVTGGVWAGTAFSKYLNKDK